MSSFDPPLSRITATLLTLGAILAVAWVLYAAYRAPMAKRTDSIVGSVVVR